MRKKESYVSPAVEVVEVLVESGFAQTVTTSSSVQESTRGSGSGSTDYWF